MGSLNTLVSTFADQRCSSHSFDIRIDHQTAPRIVLREKSPILAHFSMPLPLALQSSPDLK
ncbi:hypothetical protein F2Q70_00016264 [Brassica cretica]|uniref:Uncharacterized protein n=1 Tax=Brassica cretica TaxID=69181 RepID=A0A8S9HWA0_BRACR|nr:hypothetical protein F2Q70_00016264 [Brassica cretica]